MPIESDDQTLHHASELVGLGRSEIFRLERIIRKIVELIVRVFRGFRREIVVDDFPIAIAINSEIVAAMRGMRIVH